MKLLLDTHAFLWWVSEDERMSRRAHELIAEPQNEVFFSVVNAWEVILKAGLGRLTLTKSPEQLIPEQLEKNSFALLPLHLSHVLGLQALPDLHRDPFDRLLIAQANTEGLTLITADRQIQQYRVEVTW